MNIKLDEFFESTSILITGGTGFIGKVLIEKLLRSQNNINKLYILIRSKKGQDAEDRAKNIFDQPIFQQVKESNPNYMDKVVIMQGDILEPCLGLSEENVKRISDEIDIVYNCAASVNLHANLKHSVQYNLESVLELLELCRRMKRLKSVVIVSTAYSNCNRKVIEEKIYPASVSAELAISMCKGLEDDVLAGITNTILNGLQSPYVLSKSIMEDSLRCYNELPIVLFRPAIVAAAYEEPVPGWAETLNGVFGTFFCVAMGLLRVTPFDGRISVNWVPVDLCTNALICSAWHGVQSRSLNKTNEVVVYNYACENFKRPLGDIFNALYRKNIRLQGSVWRQMVLNTKNRCLYYFLLLFVQYLPTYLLDIFMTVTGNKIRLNKIYNEKIAPRVKFMTHFGHNEWTFEERNTTTMWESLGETERKRYNFDSKSIDFDSYITSFWIGIKVYVAKEDMETNAAALRKHKMLNVVHFTVMSLVAISVIWIFYILFVYVMGF